MISCTEFIPSYSTLFSFLETRYGADEVHRYWNDIFDPERNGLLNQEVSQNGILGCWNYWSHSLNEEAAEFDMYLNEEDGWFSIRMHHCPSKGRLLALTHITPYHDYCSHCDLYRKTIEKYGLRYDYDFTDVGEAGCLLCITDPKKYKGVRKITPTTHAMRRKAGDNQYLHRDFHLYLNMGLEYLGSHFGTAAVEDYLAEYARTYYSPLIAAIRENGLAALRENILETYQAEEVADAVTAELDGRVLTVHVSACPAVAHLKYRQQTVSKWYRLSTETVMRTIAETAGYQFAMEQYEQDSGRAAYTVRP